MFVLVLIFAAALGSAGARLIINGSKTGSAYDIVIGGLTILIGCAQGAIYSS